MYLDLLVLNSSRDRQKKASGFRNLEEEFRVSRLRADEVCGELGGEGGLVRPTMSQSPACWWPAVRAWSCGRCPGQLPEEAERRTYCPALRDLTR